MIAMVAWNAPVVESLERVGGLSSMLVTDGVHWNTLFVGLGVLSFAFVCQHSAFIIAGSLKQPTTHRWSIVTRIALVFCAMLATTSGLVGYLGYQEGTQGNILNNLDDKSLTANFARAMLGGTMLFVYPLESFVARHVCVILLFAGRRAHEGDDSAVLHRRDRRIGLTVILYVLAVVPAAVFNELGPVLAITGAVGGSCLSYIGPGMLYLGIHGGRFLELVQEFKWTRRWFPAAPSVRPPIQGKGTTSNSTTVTTATSTVSETATNTTKSVMTTTTTTTTAVESTPLVTSTETALLIMEEAQQRQQQQQQQIESKESMDDYSWWQIGLQSIVWYGTAMPLWCAIARGGRGGLTRHIHDMALKSPHPIRIGDVQYQRMAVTPQGRVSAPESSLGAAVLKPPGGWNASSNPKSRDDQSVPLMALAHSTSMGYGNDEEDEKDDYDDDTRSDWSGTGRKKKKASSRPTGDINQQIGQRILEQQKKVQQQQKRSSTNILEPDPQEIPPGWKDFIVAFFYILFGLLALIAGIISLFIQQ
jgi:hypothetical protein